MKPVDDILEIVDSTSFIDHDKYVKKSDKYHIFRRKENCISLYIMS